MTPCQQAEGFQGEEQIEKPLPVDLLLYWMLHDVCINVHKDIPVFVLAVHGQHGLPILCDSRFGVGHVTGRRQNGEKFKNQMIAKTRKKRYKQSRNVRTTERNRELFLKMYIPFEKVNHIGFVHP